MKSFLRVLLFCAVCVGLFVSLAKADSVSSIDFSGGSGGALSFTPPTISNPGTPFKLAGVPITRVWQAPANTPLFYVIGGALNVTSGPYVSGTPLPTASNPTYDAMFGAGGSFVIMGTVCTKNVVVCSPADTVVPNSMLASGSFDAGGEFSAKKTGGFYNAPLIVPLGGINPTLEAALGFPSGAFESQGNGVETETLIKVKLSFGTFGGKVGSTNVVITPLPVPEPTTLTLLGLGLIGVAGRLRRKKRS